MKLVFVPVMFFMMAPWTYRKRYRCFNAYPKQTSRKKTVFCFHSSLHGSWYPLLYLANGSPCHVGRVNL